MGKSFLYCKVAENACSRTKGHVRWMGLLAVVIKRRTLTDDFRPGKETDAGFLLHLSRLFFAILGKHQTSISVPALIVLTKKLLLCGGRELLLIHSFFKLQNTGITIRVYIYRWVIFLSSRRRTPLCRSQAAERAWGPCWAWAVEDGLEACRICAAK